MHHNNLTDENTLVLPAYARNGSAYQRLAMRFLCSKFPTNPHRGRRTSDLWAPGSPHWPANKPDDK
jgi:hypothetical protein